MLRIQISFEWVSSLSDNYRYSDFTVGAKPRGQYRKSTKFGFSFLAAGL
jgi:hypothetical protein